MRADAERGSAHPQVVYRDGSAASIPAAARRVRLRVPVRWSSITFRTFAACARELYRVVKPGGLRVHRNTFGGRLDGVPLYRFFPSARAIDEARLPSDGPASASTFEANGFGFVTLEAVEQEIDPSLRAHYERIGHRALSTFELITDAEFQEGLERMRQAVRLETTPAPVLERVDLLVLRRQGDLTAGPSPGVAGESHAVVGVAQVRRQRRAMGHRTQGSAWRQAPPRLTRRVPAWGPRGFQRRRAW